MKCQLCGDTECDTVRCAGCARVVCYDCSDWLCNLDDYDDGDHFCHKCQPFSETLPNGGDLETPDFTA